MIDAGLDQETTDWIIDATSALRITVERQSAGGSRAGFAVFVETPDGERRALWLRMETGAGPQSGSIYTLRREAAVYRALGGRGLRIAELVAVHPKNEAFLMQRISGRNWFAEVLEPSRQERLATQLMEQLATLHSIDVRSLELPELGEVRSLQDHIVDEIDIWDAQYRAQNDDAPMIELALAWLRRNIPPDEGDGVVLVQGDTGPGNFMYDGDELVAITDWEMAHYGDFHDDLAWIYVRDLQERFTDLRDRLRDYEKFSGRRVDPGRLRYFLVLAQTRCAIGTRNGLLARDNRAEIASHLIFSTLHQRQLAEALALAIGVTDEPIDRMPDPGETDSTWMFDVALDDLRDLILPSVKDGFASRRTKGVARLLKYLREHDRYGATLDQLELTEITDLLGKPQPDLTAARAELSRRVARDHIDDTKAVRFFVRHHERVAQITRPAMGALADRRYSPLPPIDSTNEMY